MPPRATSRNSFDTLPLFVIQLSPLAVVITAAALQAAVYYVAPAGNDSNPGTLAQPFKTLNKAGTVAQPGDTVWLRGGVYTGQRYEIHCEGTAHAPITFAAYPGETPVFDATGVSMEETQSAVFLGETHNCIFDGLHVRNSAGRGLSYYETTNLIIRNCTIYNVGYRGLGGSGIHIWMISNHVYNTCLMNEHGTHGSEGWPSALATTVFWSDGRRSSNVVIRAHYIHDNWGEGIGALTCDNVVIEDNISANNYSVLLYLDSTRNARVARNYLYVTTNRYNRSDNGKRPNGIAVANEASGNLSPQNIIIANNIIAGTEKGVSYWQATTNPSSNNRYADIKRRHRAGAAQRYVVLLCGAPGRVLQQRIVTEAQQLTLRARHKAERVAHQLLHAPRQRNNLC